MNLNNLETKYTFDDLLIVPAYSEIDSISKEISTETTVGKAALDIPIISAAMTTVTEVDMQKAMERNGGFGIHHRYIDSTLTFEERLERFYTWACRGPVAVSPSMGKEFVAALAHELRNQWAIFSIDVAHGNRLEVIEFAVFLKSLGVSVWSGNIVTTDAAKRYWNILDPDTDAIKIGIGPGSACSTRVVSGCGYPQASAISEIYNDISNPGISIIADGGIKSAGDIVKALALGADAVIIGGLLAGTREAPGEHYSDMHGQDWKIFMGMASEEALQGAGKTVRVEGVTGRVPYTGSVNHILKQLKDGIATGLAYTGSRNISELRDNVAFVRQTQAGVSEGQPRI